MKSNKLTVIPTAELLSEMQELEVFGGLDVGDIHVHLVANCYNNSGNCAPQCGCTVEKEKPEKDEPSKP